MTYNVLKPHTDLILTCFKSECIGHYEEFESFIEEKLKPFKRIDTLFF